MKEKLLIQIIIFYLPIYGNIIEFRTTAARFPSAHEILKVTYGVREINSWLTITQYIYIFYRVGFNNIFIYCVSNIVIKSNLKIITQYSLIASQKLIIYTLHNIVIYSN